MLRSEEWMQARLDDYGLADTPANREAVEHRQDHIDAEREDGIWRPDDSASRAVPRNSPYAPVVQPLHESKEGERSTMTATDLEYERPITMQEAAAMLPTSCTLERGDDGAYALHIGGRTLFINSMAPIEFAVPK
jgi:hypothetical protein